MDDTFDQLDQAAVAGAEGTAWPISDLPSSAAFPVFDTFAPDDAPHPSFHPTPSISFHHPPSSTPISIPIPIPAPQLKSEPVDASMTDSPSSPSFSSTATTPSSFHNPHPGLTLHSQHPSRAFAPMRATRKRRAAAVDELSTSPTSIAIGPDNHHHSIDDELDRDRLSRKVNLRKAKSATDSSNDDEARDNNTNSASSKIGGGPASSSDTAMGDASSPLPSTCTTLSPHDLTDLSGTTAARSRKMTEEERKIMLHKRRLRNRASAARSREKRSRTLNELTSEVEDLMKKSARLAQQATQAVEEARKLRAKNFILMKENELLKAELKP